METQSGTFHLASSPRRRMSVTRRRHAHNYLVLGLSAAERGATDEALQHYQRALYYDADFREVLNALANLEFSRGRLLEARYYCERLIELDPHEIAAHLLFANIALVAHDLPSAQRAFRQVIQLGDHSLEVRYNLGIICISLDDGREALHILSALSEDYPAHCRVWDALGCARRIQHDLDGAIAAFSHAIELDAANNESRDHLAQLLLERGEVQRARHILEAALALEPQRETSRHLLGITYHAQQQYTQAIACWEALISDGIAGADTYHLLANVYLHLRNEMQAQQTLHALLERFPDHLPAHLQLAMISFSHGNQKAGHHHLACARHIDPNHPALRQALLATESLITHTPLSQKS